MSIVLIESLDSTTTEWSSKTKTKCEVSKAQFWCPHSPFSAYFPLFPSSPPPPSGWWISLLSTLPFLQSRPIFQKVCSEFSLHFSTSGWYLVYFPWWHWLLFPLLCSAESWSVHRRSEPGRNCRCFWETYERKHVCAHYIHVNMHKHPSRWLVLN